ncbi:hypothetical protein M413DRAFT_444606 [Hebeloma cylindrosporum]|uniref:Uncharacterized protein n=1 Tax=Hebeloma cylindrosporum TaxID=76867 RepID=A0A0C2XWY4_HEBCY|nr:hypothetical protein M413DRAFT_444606 [Hebeloma cylindrosporum h7]
MSLELTEHNVQTVLGVYPERYFTVLPLVFEALVKPDIDEMAQYTYVKAIHDQLLADERPEGHMGFDTFEEAAIESGIVKTMLTITQDTRTSQWPALSGYFALQLMWHLTKTGTSYERRALLKELMDHNALEIILNKLENHPLVSHRQCAANVLRCLTSENFLGEVLSSKQMSDVMVKLSRYILMGHDMFSAQMLNPTTTWQSFLCFGQFGHSREKASRYAARYYAMSQESASWSIQGLLLITPPPSQQFCHEVLKHDPELIDLLFKCAAVPREAWYPELQVDSIICEAIVMLFRVPSFSLPGVSINLDYDFQKTTEEEWAAVLDSLKLFTSRPNWSQMILGVWEMMENETPQSVKKLLDQVKSRYYAQEPPDTESFLATFGYRGSCRICIERFIATLTHAGSDANITDNDLISLLRIGNGGSRPVKTIGQLRSPTDQYNFLESSFELYRKPMSAVFTQEKVEPPLQVADETVMGPTAHARLLTLLAQRGLLQKIPRMTKLPNGVSTRTTLALLKQMTSPAAIRQFLALARQRVTARREKGHKRFRVDKELDYAYIAYLTAAELAAALVAFDVATKGAYSVDVQGVRKELVLSLGNGAEMALGLEQYERALALAARSVEAAQVLPEDDSPDAVESHIKDKNRRRVQRAQYGLSGGAS